MRQVVIYPGEDGYWVVECPSLPGCISQGETKEEAIINIKEAINLYIEVLKEDKISVPQEQFGTMVVTV
jgi:predicted RNase H-like HicB family nuclease